MRELFLKSASIFGVDANSIIFANDVDFRKKYGLFNILRIDPLSVHIPPPTHLQAKVFVGSKLSEQPCKL